MFTCKFERKLVSSSQQLLAKAEKEIKSFNGTFAGDNSKGTFLIPTPLGSLSGNYSINVNQIKIEITEKPFVVSCKIIEQKLDEYLQSDNLNLNESNPNRDNIHWGDWKKDQCSGQGIRQYSSIIWGLDKYPRENWIGMCYSQPINNIPGQSFAGPNRCKWDAFGFHVWGEVDVPDTNCGQPPPPPGNDGVIKNCSLRSRSLSGVYFQETKMNNNQKIFKIYISLWRTKETQKMQNCICEEVLPNEGLFLRVTAYQNNAPAMGRWYNNNDILQPSNEFPFHTLDGIYCKFLPQQFNNNITFYANFFRRDSFGQRELEVVNKGEYTLHDGGIIVPRK
jgi:hypothetical protein